MTCSRQLAILIVAIIGATACSGSSQQADQISEPAPVVSPEATASPDTTASPEAEPTAVEVAPPEPTADVLEIVATLASDELMGRDNQTATSFATQEFLLGQLELVADPAGPGEGRDGYRFEYDQGTNLIGIIPGSDLAQEYVLVGAHYDHVGSDCRGVSAADDICNGAADNAAGVAAAIQLARTLADHHPRRSVIVALWDGEEDGLVGATRYVADPVVPLDQIIGYINFDIQGANLTPSLSSATIMIGAETGGENLVASSLAATADSPLDTASFSLIYGQGRSDHAPFASAGVPVVFFTDATNGCYHTVDDDLDALDFAKLDLQIANAARLALDLVDTDTPPVFDRDAKFTAFHDAVALRDLVTALQPDFALLGPDGEVESAALLVLLDEIVQAGPEGYVGPAANIVLAGVVKLVERLANGPCLPVN